MIAKAERMSNSEQDKFYHKSNNKNNRNSWRTSNSRKRNHSRSKSRSRSRERTGKYNTHYSAQSTEQKQMYQRPKENDDYYQQTAHMSSSSRIKNWKKDKDNDGKCESESSLSGLKETSADRINNANEITKSENTGVLSEAEMNKLGARIIKAEIMGDEVCFAVLLSASLLIFFDFTLRIILSLQQLATQLKGQLEQARKLIATNKAVVQEGTVILTRTDEKGMLLFF